MNWQKSPIGMVRFDELINTLNALILTGACDYRTLVIVAAAYGLQDYLIKPAPVIVETPQRQLERVTR